MNQDPLYESFISNRERLLERSRFARQALNEWIETHRTLDATITDLAKLEGLLSERKQHLEELIALDESLMTHLLTRRQAKTPDGHSA